MPTAGKLHPMYFGTFDEFKALSSIDADAVYVITDKRALYIGDTQYCCYAMSGSTLPTTAVAPDTMFIKTSSEGIETYHTANGVTWSLIAKLDGNGRFPSSMMPDTYIPVSQRGSADGVAPLDANGTVPTNYLPSFTTPDYVNEQIATRAPLQHTHSTSDVNGLDNTIQTIIEIANGKCRSYIFDYRSASDENYVKYSGDDKSEKTILDDVLATDTEFVGKLNTGDILLIRDVGVPDYWWDKTTSTKQILETTKVDLTEYSTHAQTDAKVNAAVAALPAVARSGKYSDLLGKPVISNKAYSNGETWYFPLGQMVIDNSGNYGNFTFTGRLGGWINSNAATYSIMLMNRANYTGDIITATVSASGQVANALAITDIVVAKNSDLSNTVYLKCNGYFCFDFAYTEYQHSIIYDGSYSTTAPSDIIWTLSEAPKTILSADGSFEASGGINASKLGGYGLRIVEDENDPGQTGYITIIK